MSKRAHRRQYEKAHHPDRDAEGRLDLTHVHNARMLYRNAQGQVNTIGTTIELQQLLKDEQNIIWVDLDRPSVAEAEHILKQVFNFHPLLADDLLTEAHIPMLNDYGPYIQLVLHGIHFHAGDHDIDTDEIDVVLGSHFVVTHHVEPIQGLERVWNACVRDGRPIAGGADHLVYELVDQIVSDFLPAIDHLDEEIDLIEDEVFANPTPKTLDRIFQLKRAALHLRRIIAPQREVVNRLARDNYTVIDERDQMYYRNVYDQLVRMYDLNESLRDLATGALDTYLSVTSYRINEVMKVLTVFTALFMPISFLAGAFGMNFEVLPWKEPWFFGVALLAMIVTPIIFWWYFKQKNWL